MYALVCKPKVRIEYSESTNCAPLGSKDCPYKNCAHQKCTVEFEIKEEMKGEVYMYYELEKFFQSHLHVPLSYR